MLGNRTGTVSITAIALATLMLSQPAAATNCLWGGGTGKFRDKNWTNCGVPEKKDNVVIGDYRLKPPTGFVTINQQQEFHDLTLSAGSTINLNFIALINGNSFANYGTFNVVQTSNVRPYFRSYSKNLIISGNGVIVLDNGDLGGNMTFGAGQIVLGAGTIGTDSERLFNDGEITANFAGKEILFRNAINGTGRFRSQNNASLHFTGASSGDYLVNNSLVQLDGADFTVARDYQGAYFYSGNDFDARRTVTGTGQILAADARQSVSGPRLAGNVIDFGAMRVGDKVGTSLVVANTGGLTTLRGAVQSRYAPNVQVTSPDFVLLPGAPGHGSGLTFTGTSAGRISGQTIDVVNNFSNIADDHFAVSASVYAPAVVYLPSATVDFGTVRKGAAGVVAGATIANLAAGGLTDTLLTSIGATPGNIGVVAAPGPLAAGQFGTAAFGLDTGAAGFVGGTTVIGFASHDAELADLSLGSKTLVFAGTVTDPAVAALAKQAGAGDFAGGDGVYTLDLGRVGFGTVATEIAVLNTVFASAFAETLGGGFTLTGDAGYSFAGDAFAGLAGGGRDLGNRLGFDTRRLAAGTYRSVLTFTGFSRYPGLDDLMLNPLRVTIKATVVPEPASWALMIAGFATVGLALRRGRATAAPGPDRRRVGLV